MFRGLVFYLVVYFSFPPQIWSSALEARAAQPPDNGTQTAPTSQKDDRLEVRRALHLSAWKLSKLVQAQIPGILKLRSAEYYASLEPYAGCALPYKEAPKDIGEVDKQILEPAQKAVAAFLTAHAEDLGTMNLPADLNVKIQPALDLTISPETKAQCQPSVWRPEASTFTGGTLQAYLAQAYQEGRAYQEPFAVGIARFKNGPVSNLEARGWIGWLSSLREFRNLLARYYSLKEGNAAGITPAPTMKVSPYVGKKLAENIEQFRADRAGALAAKILSGVSIGGELGALPHFEPCDPTGRKDRAWCYAEGKRSSGVESEEEVLLTLQIPERRNHPGTQLNALRKLGIKALFAELATVNTLLQKDAVPLDNACREQGDLAALTKLYDKLSTVDQKLYWAQQFGQSVEKVEEAFRDGKETLPLPRSPRFFDIAQTTANEWVEAFFRRNTYTVAPAGAAPADPKKTRLMGELAAIPFRARLAEGNRGLGGGDFAQILGEKLRVWFMLVQEDLGVLPPESRRPVVEKMVEEVVHYSLVDALEGYVVSAAAEEQLDTKAVDELWQTQYRANWDGALRSEGLLPDVHDMATRVTDLLFQSDALKGNFDGEKIADAVLTGYVRKITPRVQEAVRAQDTARFLGALVEWKHSVYSLLPGPWNLNWQLAGGLRGPGFLTGSPSYFQVDDGEGHGYGYTMAPPDTTTPEGFVHVQGALKAIAERFRPQLIEKLKARGYTDRITRLEFGTSGARNVGVLADLVLRKFGETVQANEDLDRGRVAEARTRSFKPLLAWLKNSQARAQYEEEAKKFSAYLYERYLKGILESPVHDKAWEEALTNELDLLRRNETFLMTSSKDELLAAFGRYEKGLSEEREAEKWAPVKAELRKAQQDTQDKNIFEGNEDWQKFCADKKACRAWLDSTMKPIADEKVRRGLYDVQAVAIAQHFLDVFLRNFGQDGPLYDGARPADPVKAGALVSIREGLSRGLGGWPEDPREIDWVNGRVDTFLKEASRRAHNERIEPEILIGQLLPSVTAQLDGLFDIWNAQLERRVGRIARAIGTTTGREKALASCYADLNLVFTREYGFLTAYSRRTLAKGLFERALARVLLPDFAKFREELSKRIKVALVPHVLAAQVEQELRAKGDERWSVLRKAKGNPVEIQKLEQSEEVKKIDREMERLEKLQALAWEKNRNYLELRRLLRNYLCQESEVGLCHIPEAGLALGGDDEKMKAEELWSAYARDQFVESKVDGTGEAMALSPAEIVADLNRIAEGTTEKLPFEETQAQAFLSSLSDYCSAASRPESAAAFEAAYRATLVKDISQLRDVRGLLQFVLAGLEPTPGMAALKARLERLYAFRDDKSDDGEFSRFFRTLPFAVYSPSLLEKLVARTLPGPSAFCKTTQARAEALGKTIKEISSEKPILEETKASYWELVQTTSDLLFNPSSVFAPLIDADGKVHWLSAAPSPELPGFPRFDGDPMKTPATDAAVTFALVAFASLPGVTEEKWGRVLAGVRPKVGVSVEARINFLRGLDLSARRRLYDQLQSYFLTALTKKTTAAYADVFDPSETPLPDYKAWHKTLRHLLLYWDGLKRGLRVSASPLAAPTLPEFAETSRAIFRHFLYGTPYRLKDNRLAVVKHPGSEEDAMDLFDKMSPQFQRRLVEDIEDLYIAESRRQPSPFLTVFQPAEKAPGTTYMLSKEEGRLTFYVNHFVFEPIPLETRLTKRTTSEWREFFVGRAASGLRADTADTKRFAFDLRAPIAGLEARQAEQLKAWIGSWEKSPEVASHFASLKKEKAAKSRQGLWDLFDSFESFKASKLFSQALGLVAQLDNNSRSGFAPKTYPYFLAQLNWNIRHYGSEPPVGPMPDPAPPSEHLLAKLTEEVVASLDLDLRDFNGWEKLLKKKGQPEEWLMIAESKKNLLVGAGESRFLGTLVEAPYVVNPTSLAPDYNYRPFPIVDETERTQFCSDLPFEKWRLKTEDPALYQKYRVSPDEEATGKRPLFESLVGVQGELIGEKDIQAAAGSTRRDRFSSNQGKWDSYTFGNVPFSSERLAQLSSRVRALGADVSEGEVKNVLAAREALVDFRRTVSELNLKYAHEPFRLLQGRGNDLPQRWSAYTSELTAMLARFAKQMGSIEPLPDLSPKNASSLSTAERRREAMARAIYWASQLTNRKVFNPAKTDAEKARLKTVISAIDGFYTEAGQKVEVKRGLKTVAGNINRQLKALCEASAIADISTEADLQKARKLLMEDTKIVFFDNLIQLLYFDSGWIKDGENSQTRRLLAEMARSQAESKKLMDNVSSFVTWTVAISMVTLLLGKTNPAMARTVLGSRAVQVGFMGLSIAAALGFAAIETYQIYEDYWGRPDELSLLTSLRDSQFKGGTPLMKDESAAMLAEGGRLITADQQSKLRWMFHVWGIVAGVQGLSPMIRWAKGGAAYLLQLRNPMRPVNLRFKPHARWLGLGTAASPYQAVEALAPEEAQARLLEAYRKALKGTLGPNETIVLDADVAAKLKSDAKLQLEQLCRDLELNPETLLPKGEASDLGPAREWYDPRRLLQQKAKWLEGARAQSRPHLEFLQKLIARLELSKPQITANDMVSLAGVELDPVIRHTPFWMSLIGVSKVSPTVRLLRELRAIAQADLDILALHDPQLLQAINYYNALALDGSTPLRKWELFSPYLRSKTARMPAVVRRYFNALQGEAESLAERTVNEAGTVYGSAAEKELARVKLYRETIDDVLRGSTVDSRRRELVERFDVMMRESLGGYKKAAIEHYKEAFLREQGLLPEKPAQDRIETIHRLAAWRVRAHAHVAEFARNRGVSEEEVMYWMLDKQHPNYKLFTPPEGEGFDPFIEPGSLGTNELHGPYDIHQAAGELRAIMEKGGWMPDPDLLEAIAKADYRAMASRLVRLRVTRMIPEDGEEFPGEGETSPGPIVGREEGEVTPPPPPEVILTPAELREKVAKGLEEGVTISVDKAAKAALEKGATETEVGQVKERARELAKKRVEQYLKDLDSALATLKQKEGFAYTLEYRIVKARADRSVKDMAKFYEREVAKATSAPSGETAKAARLEELRESLKAQLDASVNAIGEEAAKEAARRGAQPREVAEAKLAAEKAARDRADKYFEELSKEIKKAMGLKLEGYEIDLKLMELRRQGELRLKGMQTFYERELKGKTLRSAFDEALELVRSQRGMGILHDLTPMLKLVSDARKIPAEDAAFVMDLVLRRGSAEALERELGVLRRFKKIDAEGIRRYRTAIAYVRAMELAETMPTWAERKALLEWCLDLYLSKTSLVTADRMSLAEAREVLGLHAGTHPGAEQIDSAVAAAKSAGMDTGAIDEAASLLKAQHPLVRDLGRPETMALALDIPVEYLPSQAIANSIAKRRMIADSAAEAAYVRRYGASMRETVEDAFLCLGLPKDAAETAVVERVRVLKEDLAKTIEGAASDPAAQALHKVALDRVLLSEKILQNRAAYPARFDSPRTLVPKYVPVPVDFAADPFFKAAVKELDAELVAGILKKGYAESRLELMGAMAYGKVPFGAVSGAERITRLMSAVEMLQSARKAANVTNEAALDAVWKILLDHFVHAKSLRFPMSIEEAEEFVFRTFKRLQNMEKSDLKLYRPERLEELWNYCLSQEKAVTDGKGELTKEHLEKLKEATIQLRMTSFASGEWKLENMGTETMSLLTASQAPNEVLIALVKQAEASPEMAGDLKRILYSLCDASHVRWDTTRGTHVVGDLYWFLFGPEGESLPAGITPLHRQALQMELQFRLQWAMASGDTAQTEAVERAIKRLGGGD